MNVTQTVEGLERYPVNLRYLRDFRNDLDALRRVLVPTPSGAHIPITQVADIKIHKGPPGIKSENARRTAWIYVDLKGIDVGTYVANAQKIISEKIKLPAGYNMVWSGQYEYMQAAKARLMVVIPLTLLIIFVIIYLNTKSLIKTGIVFSPCRSRWSAASGSSICSATTFGGGLGGGHRPGRDFGRNRGGHAPLPRPGLRAVEKPRPDEDPGRSGAGHSPWRGQTHPAQGHDHLRDHRRSGADHVEPRRRRRRHETHRRPDDRRGGHLRPHGTAGLSGHLLHLAADRAGEKSRACRRRGNR